MSRTKIEKRYYDYEDLMEVAKGGYVQGSLDALSKCSLEDALESKEELYDFIAYKWAGDGYTAAEIAEMEEEK